MQAVKCYYIGGLDSLPHRTYGCK
ncbi:hypothetical protein NPIL_195591, partial [Nephila pilipes]